jgi:serine/threonine protein kinase
LWRFCFGLLSSFVALGADPFTGEPMESPASWNRLTAALALCGLRALERAWEHVARCGYVIDSPTNRARFAAHVARLPGHLGEPGPSPARILAVLLDRDRAVTATGQRPDPWGGRAIADLDRYSDEKRADLTAGAQTTAAFLRAETARWCVPDYRLGPKRSAGHRTECFAAVDAETGKACEVELLRRDASEVVEWFQRVADTLGRLDSPSIPRRIAFGEADGQWYLVCSESPGETLVDVVAQHGPLPAWAVARTIDGIAGALAHAHKRGVVYGALSPQRVRLSDVGAAYLMGFGEFPPPEAPLGNPLHLAPELLLTADPPQPAADVYGLAGVAYYLFCGQFAGTGETAPLEYLGARVNELLTTARSADPAQRVFRVAGDGAEVEGSTPELFARALKAALPDELVSPYVSVWHYFPLVWFERVRRYDVRDGSEEAIREQIAFEGAVREICFYCGHWETDERRAFLAPLRPAIPVLIESLNLHLADPERVAWLLGELGEPIPDGLRQRDRASGRALPLRPPDPHAGGA